DISDFYSVHPDLGTLDDFKDLVETCHEKGMRIIIDLVINHTSDRCKWFQIGEVDKNSPYRDYYVWSDTDKKYEDARIIFMDTEASNWTWSEKAGQFYWHRFFSSQPDLNYDNPAVREEMKNIMRFWLEMGIDGFRADAVPYLIEREGTNCENLPETHAYLKEMRKLMDTEYPGRILLAEANQWPQDLIPYLKDSSEFHMAFHFPIMPRIFKSVAVGSSESLVKTLKNTPKIPDDCQWCTFLRNHDELTLEMVTEEERQFMWDFYAPEARMRLNQGIRRRLAPLMEGDMHKVELLYAILFSLPGAVIIYYGDEIGMGDNIWLDDRNGLRTPMQWTGGENAGFSTGKPETFFQPLIDSGAFSYKRVNVESQIADENSFLSRLKRLIHVRKAHPVFTRPAYSILQEERKEVLSIMRSNGNETILCLHNLTGSEQKIPLGSRVYQILQASSDFIDEPAKILRDITLKPYAYVWLIEL
ncbi:MAG: maltose alpha-D-glucosyltransferase, partial [Anaerolineaceae bacterium]|nr:maltose alpha-D-glucosyltransferase [Anaerolineaceae bacterium]